MALAVCVARWRRTHPGPAPLALIVDHGLRPESAQEAADTAARLRNLGLESRILSWNHADLPPKKHETARRARFRLLTAACRENDCGTLLFAHHADDQAETILMRMAKGSGPAGLAGIAVQNTIDGVRLLRPFLAMPGIGKAELVATCRAADIAFATDPSNESQAYARGRLRRLQPLLAAEGFTRDSLLLLGRRAAEAEQALAATVNAFLQSHAKTEPSGLIRIDKMALRAAPRGIALRAIAAAMAHLHHGDYPPDYAAQEALCDALLADGATGARSLSGCLVSSAPAHLLVLREPSAIRDEPPFIAGQSVIWDERWHVRAAASYNVPEACRLAPLGATPHAELDRLSPGLTHRVRQGRVRAALPGLWRGPQLIAIPVLLPNGDAALPEFSAFPAKQPFPSGK